MNIGDLEETSRVLGIEHKQHQGVHTPADTLPAPRCLSPLTSSGCVYDFYQKDSEGCQWLLGRSVYLSAHLSLELWVAGSFHCTQVRPNQSQSNPSPAQLIQPCSQAQGFTAGSTWPTFPSTCPWHHQHSGGSQEQRQDGWAPGMKLVLRHDGA